MTLEKYHENISYGVHGTWSIRLHGAMDCIRNTLTLTDTDHGCYYHISRPDGGPAEKEEFGKMNESIMFALLELSNELDETNHSLEHALSMVRECRRCSRRGTVTEEEKKEANRNLRLRK